MVRASTDVLQDLMPLCRLQQDTEIVTEDVLMGRRNREDVPSLDTAASIVNEGETGGDTMNAKTRHRKYEGGSESNMSLDS
ncbi:hypothetical protein E2C01_031515 [Portunus trituberculatus]|uniref:Uncharacterized protein n=1 Tax=Portunus trituberculatus TaxID=210409 RepID=A0A5B7EX18_PORTR|nr:hypothetical protein [Portunus trituberculatus]